MPVKPIGKEKRILWAMRWTESERARIEARAAERDMPISRYIIAAALGELDVGPADIEKRFEQLEDRLDRLEQASVLGGFG